MTEFAMWRRLDVPGHDAAFLERHETGWSLRGTAVFRHERGPACVEYAVDLDASWRTLRGTVQGLVAGRALRHVIDRRPEGWYLDGVPVEGLGHLVDLDFGFTPATNLQQLRRVAPGRGQVVEIPVAWLDLDSPVLTELPQRYERRDESAYWYSAPTVPYEGLLVLAGNGFARHYPGLWQMEN